MPASRAVSTIFRWAASPSAPVSAKPSLKIVATCTPALAQSAITAGTVAAGVMMKACSMGPGADAISGKAGTPSTSSRPRLIGTTRPV